MAGLGGGGGGFAVEDPKDVSASRSRGTQYTNSTGVPLLVVVGAGGGDLASFTVDGTEMMPAAGTLSGWVVIVPPDSTYSANTTGGAIGDWMEQELTG